MVRRSCWLLGKSALLWKRYEETKGEKERNSKSHKIERSCGGSLRGLHLEIFPFPHVTTSTKAIANLVQRANLQLLDRNCGQPVCVVVYLRYRGFLLALRCVPFWSREEGIYSVAGHDQFVCANHLVGCVHMRCGYVCVG